MKLYALLLAVMFAAVMVFTFALTGCVNQKPQAVSDKGDASADANLLKAQIDKLTATVETSIKASAKIEGDLAAIKATTSQPVTQTAGENGTNASNQNIGGIILQYAPVTAAGSGIVILGLWLRHIRQMAKLDLDRDNHVTDALSGMRGCQWPENERGGTEV